MDDPFLQALAPGADLPEAVYALHRFQGRLQGRCRIERGRGWLIAALLWLGRFPSSGRDVPVSLTITRDHGTWVWVRDFGGHVTRSALTFDAKSGTVREQLGALTLWLSSRRTEEGLAIDISRLAVGGLPCPRWLLPRSTTTERQDSDGRFCFDVAAALPFLGRLIRYRGWLQPAKDGTYGF
ncbi:DUF4166 domain-containing protein [Ruegeria sp. HKCCD8929]|uniref:DUF4166 domain-containing protein n=1 Tax=Ruegeria sp. HKCCD8929 TaxID=2683006 RepID=UPI00148854D4|nr:DUF4166 domain-containing protein [Ruegeria sp. HKCCD8929]